MTAPRAEPMAIRTHHIALGGLGKDLLAALESCATGAQVEFLLSRIPMVEVHLVSREAPAAIEARHLTKLTQKLRRGRLTPGDAFDLLLPIRPVIRNVSGPLIPLRWHA
jgi:hypothetical protein